MSINSNSSHNIVTKAAGSMKDLSLAWKNISSTIEMKQNQNIFLNIVKTRPIKEIQLLNYGDYFE